MKEDKTVVTSSEDFAEEAEYGDDTKKFVDPLEDVLKESE